MESFGTLVRVSGKKDKSVTASKKRKKNIHRNFRYAGMDNRSKSLLTGQRSEVALGEKKM